MSGAGGYKASYSAEQGACVEVSEGPVTGVRATEHREVGALFFTAGEWQAFSGPLRTPPADGSLRALGPACRQTVGGALSPVAQAASKRKSVMVANSVP
ncbi:DUF397 domain-containing protein [Nocardiopsis xinjiangensis]|uniref:DUF397 domain-containing protein n=1 Tax=Nocardiopsis xinjiangensis TaxID=124285 RepID=UPI000A00A391